MVENRLLGSAAKTRIHLHLKYITIQVWDYYRQKQTRCQASFLQIPVPETNHALPPWGGRLTIQKPPTMPREIGSELNPPFFCWIAANRYSWNHNGQHQSCHRLDADLFRRTHCQGDDRPRSVFRGGKNFSESHLFHLICSNSTLNSVGLRLPFQSSALGKLSVTRLFTFSYVSVVAFGPR